MTSLNKRRVKKRNESITTPNKQSLSFKDVLEDMSKETNISSSQTKKTPTVKLLVK